jgi:hypothetical protein
MPLQSKMYVMRDELLFVYVGKTVPKYAQASLSLARDTSGIPIRLISGESNRKYATRAGVSFSPLEEFYSPAEFEGARANILSNSKFRGGLWVKSLERFFILYQFAQKHSMSRVFHAELDQVLFNLDVLKSSLDSLPQVGLFVPFHSEQAAVASVFYCNSLNSLKSLLDYASFGPPFLNEMVLISEWARLNSSECHRLPTLANELKKPWDSGLQPMDLIPSAEIHGIVDAAQLGQWIGGIDPRNVDFRSKPVTKFVDAPSPTLLSREELKSIEIHYEEGSKNLYCKLGKNRIRVYNLHLHSKVHRHLVSNQGNLMKLINESNEPKTYRIPGTRRIQIMYFFTQTIRKLAENPVDLIVKIKSEIKFKLAWRKSSHPFISGDTFREVANHVWENESRKIEPQKLNDGDVIFCESELLKELEESVLINADKKIVLILGNSDQSNGSNIEPVKRLKCVTFIFAQNLEKRIEGVEVLPIGLENAWRSNYGRVRKYRSGMNHNFPKVSRIMWSFNVANNVASRLSAKNYLTDSKVADFMGDLSAKKHRDALKRYKFVAAPPGNGLDTHRTWEAIYLGCIPIVLRSHMTMRFSELGLPVLIVDSFEEVCRLEENDLARIYQELLPRFNSSAIWAQYWIDQISMRARL